MFKCLLLLIISFSFLKAEFYHPITKKCVDSYYMKNDYLYLKYSGQSSYSQTNIRTISYYSFYPNYEYVKIDNCYACREATYSNFGMTQTQFNFMMALTGLLSSFLIVVSILLNF